MARRRRESNFEACVGIASRLPWWLGIILAVLSYLVLHQIAQTPVVPSVDPKDIAGSVAGQFYPALGQGLATFGQYILPVIFLLGAVGSAVRAYRNRTSFAEARPRSEIAARRIRGVQDRPSPSAPARDWAAPAPRTPPAVGVRAAAPVCPSCGSAMVRRVAKKGANSGGEFWGCSRYPACKGIRQIGS